MGGKTTTDEILEIVRCIRDTAATKEDLKAMEASIRGDMATKIDLKGYATKDDLKAFATKDDITRLEHTIVQHVDDVIGLHQKTDTEVTAVRMTATRHQRYFEKNAHLLDLS